MSALLAANLAGYAFSTWDGGGTDDLWSNGLNWLDDLVPASGTDLVFAGTSRLTPSNDLLQFVAPSITFAAGAGAFTVGGNPVTLSGNVVNNSTATQTIAHELDLTGTSSFNAAAGNIVVSGLVNAGTGVQFLKAGTGTVSLTNGGANVLGSATAAVVARAGTLRLAGGNTATYTANGEVYVGDTSNQNVALILESGALNISTWLAVARGNGNGTVSSDLTLNGTSSITMANFSAGFNADIANNTPRGNITLNDSSVFTVQNNGNLFVLGESAGSNIVMRLNGSSTVSHSGTNSFTRIGVGGRGLLNIASSSATAAFNRVQFGTVANGAGAIWNRGNLTVAAGASTDNFALGNATGAYGYYLHDSASPLAIQEVGIGGAGGGSGVMEVRSGVVSSGNWVTMNRTNVANAVGSTLLLNGGTLRLPDIAGHFYVAQRADADSYAHIDVGSGGRLDGSANSDINLLNQARATHTTNLTIHDGGVVEAARLFAAQAAGNVAVNFNGGRLVAEASNTTFLGTNIDGIFLHAGGATIDTNGFNDTVVSGLLAPTGNGLATVAVTTGTGYIGRPTVQITGGGGLGASAIANFNEATGEVTGITITSAGSGYTSIPAVTLVGGGATVPASITSAQLGAVTGTGGLTKEGAGILTLAGASTYTGTTTINNGTLRVANTAGSGTGTGPVAVANNGTLGGTGLITGAVTVASGGALAPGAGVGTLTVGSLTLNSGSLLNYEVTSETVADRVTVTTANGLTINGGSVNLLIPGGTQTFSANGVYNLIGYNGTIGGNGLTALGIGNAVAGKSYVFGLNAGFVTLTVSTSGSTPNFWNVDANGDWATGANWTLGTPPNAPGASANFGGSGVTATAPHTVTLTTPQTVGSLSFNSAQAYTIAGPAALTLNNGAVPNSELTVTSGAHIVSAPLIASSGNTQITVVNAADALTLSGALSGNTTINKLGAGTLVMGNANTFTGAMTLNAGILEIGGDGSLGTSLTQNAGSTLRVRGASATLSKPLSYDLAGATATPLTGAADAPANFTLDVPAGSNLTISSAMNLASGSQVKIGGGTVTLTNPGANVLSNVAGLGFSLREGNMILDGGSSATYAVTAGELDIGDATPNAVNLTLQSGTLNVGTFVSVGRGTGTTALAPRLIVNGATLNAANLYTGFAAGTANFNAQPRIDLNSGSITNVSNILRLSESAGSLSVLTVSGSASVNVATRAEIGFGGKAIVNISGSPFISAAVFDVGFGSNGAGNTGVGVVNQTGGIVQQSGSAGGDWRIGGGLNNGGVGTNDALAYGSHTISGAGTLLDTGARNFQIGAGGRGVLDISNDAIVSTGAYPVVGRFPGSVGLVNVSGGSFNQTGLGNFLIVGEQGTGVVNVSGTGSIIASGAAGTSASGGSGGIRLGHTTTGVGTLNLNGGLVQTTGITESDPGAQSFLYLNGGTLRASTDNATFLQGLDRTVVGPGGAVIDTDAFLVTVGQALNAPTGSGVTTIPVLSGGAGYLGQPIVQITGDGNGATAVANLNAVGEVTSITITNPGVNYAGTPLITLLGGGATAPASLGTALVGANSTVGGLTKRGTGTLTLTGASTYTGPTAVAAGTLALAGSLSGTSTFDVRTGAFLSAPTGLTLTGTQTLRGGGTVSGALNVNGSVAPGDGAGPLTLTGSVVFNSGSSLALEIMSGTAFDQLIASDLLLSGNVNLAITLGYNPAAGSQWTVIDNQGTSVLAQNLIWSGPQGQLTEGEHFFVNGRELSISYVGGTGNDVVLTAVPEPATGLLALLSLAPLLARRSRRCR